MGLWKTLQKKKEQNDPKSHLYKADLQKELVLLTPWQNAFCDRECRKMGKYTLRLLGSIEC